MVAEASDRIFTRETWPAARRLRPVTVTADAVVVGSGAGGAVVAAELAEGGLDVVLLEEGGYHRTEDFNAEAGTSTRALYRDGGASVTVGVPSIQFAEGRCVGGSTTINGGMSWRTPERILARWQREHAVERMSAADMEPYFERVERFISARVGDAGIVGRDNELLKAGADKLGWKLVPNIRNQVHCAGSNNCIFGCPTGAKQSTLVSYVPRALRFGARLYADARVDRVLFRRGRAVGVRGHVVRAGGARGQAFEVRAPIVVVSGGAMQTPALLVRSGVRSPSGAIGKHLTVHPNGKLVAIFDEAIEGWKGVHQAYQVHEYLEDGLLMAAVNIPPSLLAMSLPLYGDELGEVIAQYDHILTCGVLVEDSSDGRVRVIGGQPVPFYQLSERDAERVVRGTALLAELLFAAGARRILAPVEGMPDLRSVDDVRQHLGRKIPMHLLDLTTMHIMGTAGMGGDPRRHVCDSYGRVYGTEGLWVSDASLFSSPIGVNPMETIMALATRNAERILETRGGN